MEYKGLHVERQVVKYKELVGVSVAYDGIFHGIFGVLSSYTSTLSPKSALGRPDSLRCVTYI